MDVLVICPDNCQRADSFLQAVRAQGYATRRLAPGQRLPAARDRVLGAVVFDIGPVFAANPVKLPREQVRFLGCPLILLSERAPAASADLVLAADTPDERILAVLKSHCSAQAVASSVRGELVEPLITAVEQTLTEMAAAEVVVQAVYSRAAPESWGDISGMVEIDAAHPGMLILSFSQAVAEALTHQVLVNATKEFTPSLVQDCVGEIVNVVAGQAKALLAGTPHAFRFGIPIVAHGKKPFVKAAAMDSLVIAFDHAAGGLALQYCRGH